MGTASVTAIYRYPVKGMSPELLSAASFEAGEMLPFDRAFAVECGSKDFDGLAPRFLPKRKFLQLMSNPELAALETSFDADSQILRIFRAGKQVAAGNLSTPIGCQLIEQFLGGFVKQGTLGAPHIVSATGHHFADVPNNFISLINLASVRDLERLIGRPVDPLRFRANLYVDGWEPWFERDLPGRRLAITDQLKFEVNEPISRCAATNVDPRTGSRDMQIPRTLSDVFGHENCGLYLTAIASGTIRHGDTVSVVEAAPSTSAGSDLGIR